MTDSDGSTPAPPDWGRISGQLDELIELAPTVKKLRRSRWLTWVVAGVVAVLVVLVPVAVKVYDSDRRQDSEQRDRDLAAQVERRQAAERARVHDCEKSNEQIANVRKGFDVLVDVLADPTDPGDVAAANSLNAGLDKALPARDCAAEAAARRRGG